MQPNYGRPPYSPTTPGYQGSQSSDGLPHHSYDGVASSFSLPAPGRSGGHSSMQHTLQNPMNAHTQGAQPSPTTTTASSDSFARSSNSTYYHSASATSHPLSYPGFTPSVAAPTHTAPSTTGTYSRSISAYSQQSQNHSVPSSPMQAPYSSRSYPNYTTLPTMAGPVLSNMSNPGGQMALVGGMGTMSPGYSHHIGQHQMYSNSQHNLHSDRPFKCDTCNSGFNRNHDLKRHTRIHLAIKPFPCTFCDKSFSRKDALKRHRLVKGCGSRNDSNDGNDNSPPDEIKPEDDDTTGPLQALRG
ncbi:hypothetical protein F4818DRAFT_249148 [Hypoxylon cercidicola]|nr:hypothetical protein F4818DRAFT_249148 [Hypoxylon cercidicola]